MPLAGILIGNGIVDTPVQRTSIRKIPRAIGAVTEDLMPQLETLERHCREAITSDPENANSICGRISGFVGAVDGGLMVYDARTFGEEFDKQEALIDEYFTMGPDNITIQKQLHVDTSPKNPVYKRSNGTVNDNMKEDVIQTIVTDYDWLLQRNLTTLIYVG